MQGIFDASVRAPCGKCEFSAVLLKGSVTLSILEIIISKFSIPSVASELGLRRGRWEAALRGPI